VVIMGSNTGQFDGQAARRLAAACRAYLRDHRSWP
jgi:hypothetical protein